MNKLQTFNPKSSHSPAPRSNFRKASNPNRWNVKLGPFGAGGNSKDSLKTIGLASLILGGATLVVYAGKKGIDRLLTSKPKTSTNLTTSTPNTQDPPTPVDIEKQAKDNDLSVKNDICIRLGLFQPETPQPQPLVTDEKASDLKFLVGDLFKVGDRAVVVSAPGVGKSILAWQTGIAIAEGRPVEYLQPDADHAEPQKVFLYDGELDDDDVKQRYGNLNPSNNNISRFPASKFRTVYYLLKHILETALVQNDDTTFILDNLFAIMPSTANEDTRNFLDGLDCIQRLAMKKGHRLTFIIVTHTTKDPKKIPQLSDVGGSAHITRFAKSELSLVSIPGEENLVAVVTSKKRYADHKDVYLMKRTDESYLHFEFVNRITKEDLEDLISGEVTYGSFPVQSPATHDQQFASPKPEGPSKKVPPEVEEFICELKINNPDWGYKTIAKHTNSYFKTSYDRQTMKNVLIRHGLVKKKTTTDL